MFKVGDKVVIKEVLEPCPIPYKIGDVGIVTKTFGRDFLWGCITLVDTGKVVDVYWTEIELVDARRLEDILTDEEIMSIDDETHFHESPDWSIRFAKNVLKAAEEKKNVALR